MVECGEEPEIEEEELDEEENGSETLLTVLNELRNLEKIEAVELNAHSWRLKERMKTVSVAIVMCLNIPVDPPDVVKLQPCARLEAWIDPLSMPPQKAIETIGNSLQKAYERWQPKARYKVSPDPTVDEIKKLCTSLRRNAKEERVLFHYNGHGVPRPTDNGEIWVFNSNYTQYIPLSIYDLQQWMGTPSIYVYDCSNAGKIVKLFQSFTKQHLNGKCIHFASCQESQMLPMNPDLPADLFTSCLTTPIRMAIRFYHLQHKNKFLPDVTLEMMDKLPGLVTDRRSMLGELNWIFTAITDTIAWNILPKEQFQKLFRQDLLVASLFRNFLLAERILLSYDCTPVSSPTIPSAVKHHMWGVWDLCLELALSQLPRILSSDPGAGYISSPFFEEQLTAFQMWLNLGSVRRPPPDQLPIVLQVLLSQVYRPRALELLGTFLNFGPWAVNLVLEVGIFPYILKLLQSTTRELQPLLTHLWAKILAVDPQCKVDLIREQKYFTNVLKDATFSVEQRTNAAFVMCSLVSDCQEGSAVALQGNILSLCLDLITDENPSLRQWVAICAARTWHLNPKARWEATRDNAPDKLIALMSDPVPEVRASAAYALGTFIKSLPINDRSDQGRLINHKIAVSLKDRLKKEASPLMRQELVVGLHYLILMYENLFRDIAKQFYKESEMMISAVSPRPNRSHQDLKSLAASSASKQSSKNNWNSPGNPGTSPASNFYETVSLLSPVGMKKSGSTFSLSFGLSSLSHEHLYLKVWQSIVALESDPFPAIAELARNITSYLKIKIDTHSFESKRMSSSQEEADLKKEASGTPVSKNGSISEDGGQPLSKTSNCNSHIRRSSYPRSSHLDEDDLFITPCISTQFVEWSANSFRKSCENFEDEKLTISDFLLSLDNTPTRMKKKSEEKWTLGTQKLDEQKFIGRNVEPAEVIMFHPSDPILLTADKTHVGVWDVASENRISLFSNMNSPNSRISSLTILNAGTSSQYVCVGSNDGVVKVWKDAFKPVNDPRFPISSPKMLNSSIVDSNSHIERENSFLVTAFRAFEENCSSKRETKLLLSWEQESTTLVTGSNADSICLWDLQTECKIQDIQTKGMWTTSLHSFGGRPWIAAGFSDGNLRLYDRRNSKPLVREWKDHSSAIITTQLFNTSATSAHIISGAESGEVRLCDLRRAGSVQVCLPGNNIYCMSCHPRAHLFAVGTHSQYINVYHTSGSAVNSLRYYNGLMGQRIGAVNCLSFHPSKVLLAVGSKEGNLAVYGLTKR